MLGRLCLAFSKYCAEKYLMRMNEANETLSTVGKKQILIVRIEAILLDNTVR